MPVWHLRDYREADLDQAIQIWDQSRQADGEVPIFPVSEVMAAAAADQASVVAAVGDEVIGMVVAQPRGDRAWVLLVALASQWRNRGVGSALLAEVERRLRAVGVRRISVLLPEGATGTKALENSGYLVRNGLAYYERIEPRARPTPTRSRCWAAGCCRAGSGRPWPAWRVRSRSSNAGSCSRWWSRRWPSATGSPRPRR